MGDDIPYKTNRPHYIVYTVFKTTWKFPVSNQDGNINLSQSENKRYYGFPMIKKMLILVILNISKLLKVIPISNIIKTFPDTGER